MEAWFGLEMASRIGGIIGGCLGAAGAIIGCLCGFCIRKGWKKLIYGTFGFVVAVCATLLIIGIMALIMKQPYHVWYSFLLPGFIGTVVFSSLFPVVHKRFIENELRQIQAKDL